MIEILKNFSNEDRQLPDFLRCGFTWKEEERRQKYHDRFAFPNDYWYI